MIFNDKTGWNVEEIKNDWKKQVYDLGSKKNDSGWIRTNKHSFDG